MSDIDPAIQQIVDDIKKGRTYQTKSRMMIDMMREAGEDTTALENEYKKNEIRLGRWENMLKARGYYK